MIDDKRIYFFFILLFFIGIFVGQIIGYYRAWNDYTNVQEFTFRYVTADLVGNTTNLEGFRKPFSCVIFNNQTEAINFYHQILEQALFEKTVCFKGK